MAVREKNMLNENVHPDGMRLNKYLSDAGYCSRREADRLIADGQVLVDGVTATLGTRVLKGQKVTVKNQLIKENNRMVLIAFNKPAGIVCTTDSVREKNNIVDYIGFPERIYPIGRLDKESTGLILLTNDGSIVNHILKASQYHEKEYLVRVDKPLTEDFIAGMEKGVPILDTVTRPCRLKMKDKYTFSIILTQGLNRQIRRMCDYFDYRVVTLKRVRIMNISLGHLKEGAWRNISDDELEKLKQQMEQQNRGGKES